MHRPWAYNTYSTVTGESDLSSFLIPCTKEIVLYQELIDLTYIDRREHIVQLPHTTVYTAVSKHDLSCDMLRFS